MQVKSYLKNQAPDPGRQNQHFSSIFAMQRLDESNHTTNLSLAKMFRLFLSFPSPQAGDQLYKYDHRITH
jgi:hypothetical protein